jgi:hypothetical protein
MKGILNELSSEVVMRFPYFRIWITFVAIHKNIKIYSR